MRVRRAILILIIIMTLCLSIFATTSINSVNGSSVGIYDFSARTNLPTNYSYGMLFWTDKTNLEVKTLNNGGKYGVNLSQKSIDFYTNTGTGAEIKFLLTNCCIDKDYDLCDVEITISDMEKFSIGGSNSPGEWEVSVHIRGNDGPLHFNLYADRASVKFSMKYFKNNTRNKANIDYTVASIGDIDYAAGNPYCTEAFCRGDEGIGIMQGNIYYDKNGRLSPTTEGSWSCVYADPIRGSGNTDGFVKNTSAVVVQPLSNATYEMKYGGFGCGIDFKFISPYVFTLDSPSKTVNITPVRNEYKIYEEETYHYTISQYVPNNYYSDVLNFISNTGGKYRSFQIKDSLSSDLKVNTNGIRVENESGQNVTSYFTINVTNNNVLTATAKANVLQNVNFYAHLYKVIIPVSVKEGTGATTNCINNTATTVATNNYGTETKNSSNSKVSLKYKVITHSQIENGITHINNISNNTNHTTHTTTDIDHNSSVSNTVYFKANYGYQVTSVTIDDTSISLNDLTQNNGTYSYTFSDRNITQNIEHKVVVKTALRDTSVEVNYIDTSGNNIADSETIKGKVFDSYATKEKQLYGYILTGTPTNATGEMTEEKITVNYVYRPYCAQVELSKLDNHTGKVITKEETMFALYEWQASTNTWVAPTHINTSSFSGTVSDGKGAMLKQKTSGTKGTYGGTIYYDLQNQGKFKVVEFSRPWGYTTSNWTTEIEVTQDGQVFAYHSQIRNNQVRGQINFKKNDREVNYKNEFYEEVFAQGDATLEGAVYGLYAKENILSPDTGNILYTAGQQMMTGTTDIEGKITWSNLYLGKYYIQEITPSVGYLKDTTQYEVDIKTQYHNYYYQQGDQTTSNIIYRNTQQEDYYENQEQRVISKENIQKQSFQLTKLSLAEDSTMADPLQGAGFKIYLIKDLKAVRDGAIQADQNGNYKIEDFREINFDKEQTALDFTNNANGERIPELFSNEDGILVSPELAYGKYVVIESTVPEGVQSILPFIVNVYEDNRTPKKMIYPIDRDFEARIRIVKKDDMTGKTVLKANASYRIWDLTKNKYIEQFVTYPNKVQYGTEENPYKTTEEGYLLTPDRLPMGEYELREVQAPEGYVIAGKEEEPKPNVRFIISTNTVYEVDPDLGLQNAIITVEQRNMPQLGNITVSKQGEFLSDYQKREEQYEFSYETRAVTDAKFAIYAKEDVYTQDNQVDENGERTKIYTKNQFIQEVETNEEGKAIFERLPLGEYVVLESKAGEGFLLNTKRTEVSFTYEGQDKAIIHKNMEYVNERQKIAMNIHKTDQDSGKSLFGVVFGLYTKEEIRYIDHSGQEQIIPANELVLKATTDQNGKATIQDDSLPLGRYYMKELQTLEGYAINPNPMDMDCSYAGQEVDKVVKETNFTNVMIKLQIRVMDAETQADLIGTQIRLRDMEGKEVGTYTIEDNGVIEVKGLQAGKQYSIEEIKQRSGYVKNLFFTNKETDENELIKAKDEKGWVIFQIKDSQEPQTVTLNNIAKVAQLEIQKTGDVLTGTKKKENGNIVFTYETQRIDTATLELRTKEDIVHPDGKQGVILPKGTKIGEGQTRNGILTITSFPEELINKQPKVVQLLLARGLPLGEYEVKELEAPEGYCKEERAKVVSLQANQDQPEIEKITATIHNRKQGTNIGKPSDDTNPEDRDIGVYKTDEDTDEPIAGVEFGLYATEDILGPENKILVKKDTLIEKVITNSDGYAKFTSDLPISKYYILETKPAPGYFKNDQKLEVDATSITPSDADYVVKLKMQNKKTQIQIAKIEKTDHGEEVTPIEGAYMQILEENGNVITQWMSSKNLQTIKGLEIGKTYRLHEEKPARGYVTAEDIKFSIRADGSLAIEEAYTMQGTQIPTIVMQDDITRIQISVVDKQSKEPIKDVVVQLVDKDTGEVVYELTTDGQEHIIEKIPVGNYKIVEKNLQNGYVSMNAEEFTITDTTNIQRKIIEQDYTKLDVQLIDENTKNPLPGAKLEIRNDQGEVVATIDDTGTHYYVERLPVGNYTIVEVVAPEGYEKISDFAFTLQDITDIQYITLTHKRLPFDLKVEKYASQILVNGVKRAGTNQVGQMVKVDLEGKKLSTQNVTITYTIRVTNTGQVPGSVGKIVDQIPAGLTFQAKRNPSYWKAEGGNRVTTTQLANRKIQPGESIELNMLLDWTKSEFNLGDKVNVVTLEGISNAVGFDEQDTSNNRSSASILLSLRTGKEIVLIKQITMIVLIELILVGIVVLIEIKLIRKKKA